MMNDTRRNATWERALTRAISPGMRALEIGTGAGVFALIAARAGAKVYICEDDPVIAAIARDSVELNGLKDRITIIERRSQQIDPDADLGRKRKITLCW
jgi:protein arginine N-methyltransferase 7